MKWADWTCVSEVGSSPNAGVSSQPRPVSVAFWGERVSLDVIRLRVPGCPVDPDSSSRHPHRREAADTGDAQEGPRELGEAEPAGWALPASSSVLGLRPRV